MLIAQRPTLAEEVVTDNRSRFSLEPLEPGFGYTLGNSLRRTLLSSIPGAAITSIRVDNVVYRAGFARTRRHARQLVVHGHFRVNGHKVDIASFQVSAHDVIDVRAKSVEMTPFIISRETHGERLVPAWLEVITNKMRVLVHSLPVRAQIDVPVQEQLIVEYYSKK